MIEDIDKTSVKISQHAIEKYCKAVQYKSSQNSEEEIKDLFLKSIPEKLNPGLIIRMMKNKFYATSFFKCGKWRFVVCDNVMVTVEVDRFRDKSIGYMKKKNLYKK